MLVANPASKAGDGSGGKGQCAADAGGLYDGFEAYRTATADDYHGLLTRGLVVPDTNVFLNLYRYNDLTRSDLFRVLGGLGDSLWVPRQVMVEFWRNRESVLQDPRDTGKTARDLAAKRDEALSTFRAWSNRVSLPTGRRQELAGLLSEAFGKVIAGVGELADDDASQFTTDTGKDPVLAGLEPILRGRVGSRLDDAEHKKALEEAKRRAVAKEPPGYMDAGKQGTGPAGDYLIWAQTLREAQRQQKDVLIVTGDVKEDWWRREHGELRGPRPELAEEMRNVAQVRLFMLRPESLLRYARLILDVEVRDESVQDIERVAELENGGWTLDAIGQFLSRLIHEGWTPQEHAIRLAASRGGLIERQIVYDLGGYGEGRSLRGFTRPVNRITQEFRQAGIVPESAIDVLQTVYDPAAGLSSGWASGFRVPDTLVPLVLEWHRARDSPPLEEPEPERLAAAIEKFRALGHDVDDSIRGEDEYGHIQWTCRKCGSSFSLVGLEGRWVSPSGQAPCAWSGLKRNEPS